MGKYNEIVAGQTDAESPGDETLFTDLIENVNYNHDHAMRTGTDAAGVRLAYARGYDTFSDTSVGANTNFSGSVVFADDAADGDPNFSDTPYVCADFTENSVAGVGWETANGVTAWSFVVTDVDSSGFDWRIQFVNSSSIDIAGTFWWHAIALPTSGE